MRSVVRRLDREIELAVSVPSGPGVPMRFVDLAAARAFLQRNLPASERARVLRSLSARLGASPVHLDDEQVLLRVARALTSGAARVVVRPLRALSVNVEGSEPEAAQPLAAEETSHAFHVIDVVPEPLPLQTSLESTPEDDEIEAWVEADDVHDPIEVDIDAPEQFDPIEADVEADATPVAESESAPEESAPIEARGPSEDGAPTQGAVPSEASEDAVDPAIKTKTFVEIALKGEDDKPIPSVRYRLVLPSGEVREGTLDEQGLARVEQLDDGECELSFPDLDDSAWQRIA